MTPTKPILTFALIALVACSTKAQKDEAVAQNSAHQVRIQALVKKSLNDMRRIEGGGFWLGDFGPLMDDKAKANNTPPGPDAKPGSNLPFTIDEDNKPARWVTFDTFYIGAYKVTYGDFDVYTQANGLPVHPPQGEEDWQRIWQKMRTSDNVPAGVHWDQAKSYCLWLGKITGLPFDLPSEGQWEYAASNRTNSYRHPFPTRSGQVDFEKARPSFKQREALLAGGAGYQVGKFEPSPVGLHDLLGNGFDWVNDWYAPDGYFSGDSHNPKGPPSGVYKVLRGEPADEDASAFRHLARKPENPNNRVSKNFYTGIVEPAVYFDQGFRCVVQTSALKP